MENKDTIDNINNVKSDPNGAKMSENTLKEILGQDYKNYSVYENSFVYKSRFNLIDSVKSFLYDLYHPSNYKK